MARQTVLLVDADPRSARVFEVSLRNAGYSVTHVQSAVEAIEAIEVAIPDLVISDTRLAPSKTAEGATALNDGYSLCRRLKDDPVWYAVPFIFLTSSASIEDKIRGLELGVEDFLTKPIYLREIITRIQLVLAKKQREGMEGRTSRASFTGLLSEMGLVDLLSTIDLGRKSGVLELEAPQGRGMVFFRDGRVVDARANKLMGGAAIYRMLLWTDGRFEIRFGPCGASEVIEMSTQGLLMEGMRRIDEWQRMREQLPALDLVFEVDVPEVLARIGEIPDEINPILRAFDGRRTLMEVVDESGIDDLEALATLTKLYFEGLIVPGKAPVGTGSDARVAPSDERRRDTLIGFDTDVESSIPSPPLDAPEDHLLLPASTPGDGVAAAASNFEGNRRTEALSSAPSSPVVPDGTGAAILPDPQGARPESNAPTSPTSQEPAVAKHRGKNRRSKREFADSSSAATKSSSPLATGSTAPVVDRDDGDEEESSPAAVVAAPAEAAPPSPSDASGSQPAVAEPPKSPEAASASTAEKPADPTPAAAAVEPTQDAASAESSGPAPKAEDAKVEGGTVIQFPRAARGSEDEKKPEETKVEDSKPAPVVDEKKPEEKKGDDKKADKKPDEKKPEEKKPEEKKADKKPEEKKPEEKKGDEKKADKKPEEKKGDKKPETGKRERKDSHGDLGDEAKAFFSDNSYEVAYKKTHDSFEDLEPEQHPDAPTNKRLMYATVALLVAIVGIVGGLAVYRKFFGVDDVTLPSTQSLLTNNSSANTTNTTAGNSTQTGSTATDSDGSSSASSNTPAVEADAASAVAASTDNDAASTTASAENDAASTTAAAEPDASAAVANSTNTASEQDAGAASANTNTANNNPPAVVDSGVAPAAPSGPAELLTAAQRAQNRGAAAAATAYQAYIDAGGNDAAAIARFAMWLATRGDLGRAGEWADRATQLDANNQLGWYVLGASKMEGPRRDAAGARAAFRRCAQLPGRYAGECRSAL